MRLLFTFLLSLCSGCGSGALAAVRAHAAVDMKCDENKLTATQSSKAVNLFDVEGCGETGRYVTACNVFGYCPTVQGQIVSKIVRKQAAFDLQCGEADIAITLLNIDTFGARGCGNQASYVIVDCHSGACKAVQNTQTQRP